MSIVVFLVSFPLVSFSLEPEESQAKQYIIKINSVCIILFGLIALRHVIVACCSSKQPCDPLEVTVTYAFGIDFNF